MGLKRMGTKLTSKLKWTPCWPSAIRLNSMPPFKNNIINYFEVTTDEALVNELFADDITTIPLPNEELYLTGTGIVFTYFQYE